MLKVVERPLFDVVSLPDFCEGQHVNLKVNTTDDVEVTWEGPLGFAASGASVMLEYVAGIQSGTYTATGVSPNGCTLTAEVQVNVGFGACAEICDNGIDDDGDGLVDCEDPSCSCCDLQAVSLRTVCRNGGTPLDISDDTYAVFAILEGNGLNGKRFSVSGDVDIPVIYAGGEILLGEFSSLTSEVSFDFVGLDDPNCVLRDQRAASPGFCTDACNVLITGVTIGECQDGQYTLTVDVIYSNGVGALNVNGKRFVLPSGYGKVALDLPNLSCTGATGLLVEAYFEGLPACTTSFEYDAACPDDYCLPLEITVGDRP